MKENRSFMLELFSFCGAGTTELQSPRGTAEEPCIRDCLTCYGCFNLCFKKDIFKFLDKISFLYLLLFQPINFGSNSIRLGLLLLTLKSSPKIIESCFYKSVLGFMNCYAIYILYFLQYQLGKIKFCLWFFHFLKPTCVDKLVYCS